MSPQRKKPRAFTTLENDPSVSSDSGPETAHVSLDGRDMLENGCENSAVNQTLLDDRFPDYIQTVISNLSLNDQQSFLDSFEFGRFTLEFSTEMDFPKEVKTVQKRPMRAKLTEDENAETDIVGSEFPSVSSQEHSRAQSQDTEESQDTQDCQDVIPTDATEQTLVSPRKTKKTRNAQKWKVELYTTITQTDENFIPESNARMISTKSEDMEWWRQNGEECRAKLQALKFDVNNLPEIKRQGKLNPKTAKARQQFRKDLIEVFKNRTAEWEDPKKATTRRKSKLKIPSPEPTDSEEEQGPVGEDEYEVARVLMRKTIRKTGELWMLLQWKGWPLDDVTWQKETDVESAPVKLEEFKNRMNVCDKLKQKCQYKDKVHYPYHRTLMLNVPRLEQFKKLAEWEWYLNKINRKLGIAQIWVENWVDDAREPLFFQYGQTNRITAAARTIFDDAKVQAFSCAEKCKGKCKRSTCCGAQFSEQFPYKDNILVIDPDQFHALECSAACNCPKDCPGKLIQRGRQVPVVLFRTADRGWSIRTATKILKNQFVMQYVGEVFLNACSPADVTYQYVMDTCGSSESVFCIDATHYGNEARWVNHSCEPNLRCVGVIASRYDYRYQELCFFATRDIEVGDELLIDYGHKLNPCRCGANNCKNPPSKKT